MVDLTFLKNFTNGNEKKIKRYIGLYLDITPYTLEKMKQNLAEGDWEQLRINAHSLKPQADYMGINDLKNCLVEIENGVKQGSLDQMDFLVRQAVKIHQESEVFLRNELALY